MTKDLEGRLRQVEDRLEIGELIVRYALLLDDARWDELAELWTEDAVFASPSSRTEGRAAIIENFKFKHAPYSATWHDPHGSVIDLIDADHARGTVIGYAELGKQDCTIATSIRYLDDYRRVDGTWRFASRHVLSMYGMPLPDLIAGGFGSELRKRWPDRGLAAAELPDYAQNFPGYPA